MNNLIHKHSYKNLKNYIISNFLYLNFLQFGNLVKSIFFYNSYNFYLSIFILFNFWFTSCKFSFKKHKISFVMLNLDFFYIFSIFFYPYLYSLNLFEKNQNVTISFTFFINRFFLNPLLSYLSKSYNVSIKKT